MATPHEISHTGEEHLESQPTEVVLAELQSWQSRLTAVFAERDNLRAELDEVRAERDGYLKRLYAHFRKDKSVPAFTKEEAISNLATNSSFDDLIAEFEQKLGHRE